MADTLLVDEENNTSTRTKWAGLFLVLIVACTTVLVFIKSATSVAPADQHHAEYQNTIDISVGALGSLTGRHRDGAVTFYGIPYAEQPGRWEYPDYPPQPWGHRDAYLRENNLYPICPQTCYGEHDYVPACPSLDTGGQSEQCLYLHITTPERMVLEPEAGHEKLPVLVYLHGGAFKFGAGSSPLYEGRFLSSFSDMVVVTVNYRLSMFGFFPYEGVSPFNGKNATGNFGLADQRRALQFVHDHIATFGGDPGKVTLGGQSAGSESTYLQMVNPGDHQEYFQRALLMSIPAGLPLVPTDIAVNILGTAVSQNANKTLGRECDVECLKDPEQVDTATLHSLNAGLGGLMLEADPTYIATHPLSLFQTIDPVIDGNFVNYQFVEASERINETVPTFDKDVMMGSCGDEGEGFVQIVLPGIFPNIGEDDPLPQSKYERIIKALWIQSPDLWRKILKRYPYTLDCNRYHKDRQGNDTLCDAREALNQYLRDYLFTCTERNMLNNLNAASSKTSVYQYYFDQPFPWVPPELNQQFANGYRRCDEFACHGVDIAYIFGLDKLFNYVYFSEDNQALIRVYINYIANFARNGDPANNSGRIDNIWTRNLNKPLAPWPALRDQKTWGYQYFAEKYPGYAGFAENPNVTDIYGDFLLDMTDSCDMWDGIGQYGQH